VPTVNHAFLGKQARPVSKLAKEKAEKPRFARLEATLKK
jgi:hypothetical protein